jgi:hypothetical protein
MLDLAEAVGRWLMWALVKVVNLLIAAVGELIAFVLGLMPSMPDVPTAPNAQALGWLAWGVPVAGIVAAFFTFVGLYVLLLVIRIAARWAKAM